MNRWELTDLARASLQSLADAEVEVLPQDILDIQAHSLEATEAPDASVSFARGTPVRIGTTDAFLWPLTFLAADFISKTVDLFQRPTSVALLVAYACAHGSEPDALLDTDDKRRLRKKVQAWADGLAATPDEIAEAVSRIFARDAAMNEQGSTSEGDGNALQDLAAELVAATGQAPEVIEHLMSVDYAADLIRRIKLADQAALRKSLEDDARAAGLGKLAKTLADIKARKHG